MKLKKLITLYLLYKENERNKIVKQKYIRLENRLMTCIA